MGNSGLRAFAMCWARSVSPCSLYHSMVTPPLGQHIISRGAELSRCHRVKTVISRFQFHSYYLAESTSSLVRVGSSSVEKGTTVHDY